PRPGGAERQQDLRRNHPRPAKRECDHQRGRDRRGAGRKWRRQVHPDEDPGRGGCFPGGALRGHLGVAGRTLPALEERPGLRTQDGRGPAGGTLRGLEASRGTFAGLGPIGVTPPASLAGELRLALRGQASDAPEERPAPGSEASRGRSLFSSRSWRKAAPLASEAGRLRAVGYRSGPSASAPLRRRTPRLASGPTPRTSTAPERAVMSWGVDIMAWTGGGTLTRWVAA